MAQKPLSAFFSYAREDSEFALKLARDLKAAGAFVWIDQLDIKPGQHWDRAVERALRDCPNMLLILSPASVASTNVMDEVSFALDEQKLIIPVLYRTCEIPFRLRRVQYVDARTEYGAALKELVQVLALDEAAEAERQTRKKEQLAAERDNAEGHRTVPVRVLWVDDNPANNRALIDQYRSLGISFDLALNTK